MVNFADTFLAFEGQALTQKWERPDFSKWVTAEKAADYFESIGEIDLAKEVRGVQALTNYNVRITAVPPNTAAFVAPWNNPKEISYNIHTLGRGADHKHIIEHESIHLRHQSQWGSTRLPGFKDLSPYAQSCFAKALWTAFTETELLEWLTEGKATDMTKYDPKCAYNLKEVPIAKRFDTLVTNRSGLMGLDFSTSNSFGRMGQSDSKQEFENAVTFAANQLMLEDAATSMWVKMTDAIATQMSTITADLIRKGKLIKNEEGAKELLKTSPVYSLGIIANTKKRIEVIGIPVDKIPPIKRENKPESAANIFGEVLEKNKENEGYKVIQKNSTDRVVKIITAGESSELGLAA